MSIIDMVESDACAVVEYSPTQAGLATLRARLQDVAYDLSTPKGMAVAVKDRAEVRTLRTGLEKMRVEIKAPALERCRLIDAEAKRITAELVALERPIDEQIKVAEDAKAAEKARKEQAERERIAAHQAAIEEIHMAAHEGVGKSSEAIRALILRIEGVETATNFEELRPIAERAKSSTLDKLEALLVAAIKQELEAQLLADRLAELERLRTETEAREKAERERIAAEHKAEAARLAAERAELDRQQAAVRAEQQRQETAALAARQAADAQAAAERAEADRQAKAVRDAEELRQREERAKQQAELDARATALRAQQDEADRVARDARLAQEQKEAAERAIAVQAALDKADAERAAKQAAEDAERARLKAADEADRRGRDAWRDLASACEDAHPELAIDSAARLAILAALSKAGVL